MKKSKQKEVELLSVALPQKVLLMYFIGSLPSEADIKKKVPVNEVDAFIEQVKSIREAGRFIEKYVTDVNYKVAANGQAELVHHLILLEGEDHEAIKKQSSDILQNADYLEFITINFFEDFEPQKKRGSDSRGILNIRDHKQSRSYAKTAAKITGRDTESVSLFSLPLEDIQQALQGSGAGLPIKEKLSKNVSVLGNLLYSIYQTEEKNSEGYILIKNLGALAEYMGTDTKELKYYLLYLGGYQYPFWSVREREKEISMQMTKLFEIVFVYDQAGQEKAIKDNRIIEAEGISIIRSEPIKRIEVKPNERLIKELNGNGMGNVKVSDGFVKLCLDLSDYAYKLLSFSYSNKPVYSIREPKLLDNLALKQIAKTQGLPRIRKMLLKAFEELQGKKHFKTFTVPFTNENLKELLNGGLYSWEYTDEYIKHQDFGGVERGNNYIDFKDTSIPKEVRKEAYCNYLVTIQKYTQKRAEGAAEQYFKVND